VALLAQMRWTFIADLKEPAPAGTFCLCLVQVIRPGDVVWCPPGVKHWHGAAADTAMTHLAVTGTLDGRSVTWMKR